MGEAGAEVAEGEEVGAVDAVAVAVAKDKELVVHHRSAQIYRNTAGRMARAVTPAGFVNAQRKATSIMQHLKIKWMVQPFIVHHDKLGAVFVLFYIN